MDNSQFNHMDKIIDGLYLGNIQGASNLAMLKKKVQEFFYWIQDLGDNTHFAGGSRL
jgi:hypothetical protein